LCLEAGPVKKSDDFEQKVLRFEKPDLVLGTRPDFLRMPAQLQCCWHKGWLRHQTHFTQPPAFSTEGNALWLAGCFSSLFAWRGLPQKGLFLFRQESPIRWSPDGKFPSG
jgi:hypothetical protein